MKSDFASIQGDLLDIGRALLQELTESDREEIERIIDDLRESRFELAVIGQIKAGKSTFLNALTERPCLLPADVNPWTAVITRLHFGQELDGRNKDVGERVGRADLHEGEGKVGGMCAVQDEQARSCNENEAHCRGERKFKTFAL